MTDHEPTSDTVPTEDPRPDGLRSADSLVVVNTGNGKGKSSSAFGMMIRAIARGWNVAVVQFIKSGDWKVGEEKVGRELGVDWFAFGDGFTWDSDDLTNDRAHAAEGWAKAAQLMQAGEHQLVIFDELTYLPSFGWIDVADIVDAISNRPRHVNVIITGRDAAPELIEIADTVTEMREVKHAYQQGIRAMPRHRLLSDPPCRQTCSVPVSPHCPDTIPRPPMRCTNGPPTCCGRAVRSPGSTRSQPGWPDGSAPRPRPSTGPPR